MELKFIGRGAAFNPKEFSNSAYFIEDNNLFLIDCGETVFRQLIVNNILEGIEEVYLMITHTHSDHIGSIGSLASYLYYKMNKKLNIIIPSNPKKDKYLNYIINILEAFSCEDKYLFLKDNELDNKFNSFNNIRYYETIHSNNLDCYCIVFDTKKGYIYYSGDSKETKVVEKLIKENKPIYKMYFDVSTSIEEDSPHLNINKLAETIPEELKTKVYCMHLDSDECIKIIEELKLNLVNL